MCAKHSTTQIHSHCIIVTINHKHWLYRYIPFYSREPTQITPYQTINFVIDNEQ